MVSIEFGTWGQDEGSSMWSGACVFDLPARTKGRNTELSYKLSKK